MKKSILASLALVALFAVSTSASGTQPAAAAPQAPQIGGCRWFCDAKPTAFLTLRECTRVCGQGCEEIC